MDLSIFERIFAMRDEVRKAQPGGDGRDYANLGSGTSGGAVATPPSLPDEKLAADLMARAVALRQQVSKTEGKAQYTSRAVTAELLQAASTPFPVFGGSALGTDHTAPTDKTDDSAFPSELRTHVAQPRRAAVKKRAPQGRKDGPPKKEAAAKREKGASGKKRKS
jgi:hypothetical protein